MISAAASSSRALHYFLPFAAVLSGCVIDCSDNDVQCNGEICCDDYGCYDIDDDDRGWGGNDDNTTSGMGGAQGGASQGGAGGEGGAVPDCDDTLIVCACADSSECAAGLSCLGGQCLDACEFDYHCGDGQVCADGQCVTACDEELPCGAGYSCVGGGCLFDPSNPECVDDAGCGAGGSCVNGLCTTACDSNAACPPGELCDGASHTCFPDGSPQPVCDQVEMTCGGSGQGCMDDGYCHYGCETTEECKLIDARYDACDRGICKTDLELDPDCSYELPCPEGFFCVSNVCAAPTPAQ